MHTTKFESFTLLHDGDLNGPMYAVGKDDVRIVVTLKKLQEALLPASGDEWLAVSGPDGDMHDRHDVTAPEFEEIRDGDWAIATIQVKRADLHECLIRARQEKITRLTEDLEVADTWQFRDIINKLDEVVERLTDLV